MILIWFWGVFPETGSGLWFLVLTSFCVSVRSFLKLFSLGSLLVTLKLNSPQTNYQTFPQQKIQHSLINFYVIKLISHHRRWALTYDLTDFFGFVNSVSSYMCWCVLNQGGPHSVTVLLKQQLEWPFRVIAVIWRFGKAKTCMKIGASKA